jgi:catechol 2,3-dioxygenase-like lactoylglutathione lyase family enzyme
VFDHVGLNVRDYGASRAFFEQALAPLGYRVVMAFDEWKAAGLGTDDKPEFWISEREPVDAFHDAALDAGGIDNGRPGPREQYHPNYYGAFVHDPDGNNIEAVCHQPE